MNLSTPSRQAGSARSSCTPHRSHSPSLTLTLLLSLSHSPSLTLPLSLSFSLSLSPYPSLFLLFLSLSLSPLSLSLTHTLAHHPHSKRTAYYTPGSTRIKAESAVERTWHTHDSQGRIMAWASSEHGTHTTVKARFWPGLSGKSLQNSQRCSLFARQRDGEAHLSPRV